MKNLLIFVVLGVFISSCNNSKYANLDSQFANSSDKSISGKYNCQQHHKAEIRKREMVRQIAIVTRNE